MGLNKTKIFLIPALVFNIIIFAIVCLAYVNRFIIGGTSKILPNIISTPKVIEKFSQYIFDEDIIVTKSDAYANTSHCLRR